MTRTTFDEAMKAGRYALLAGDHALAYQQFWRAHNLGHAVRRQHFAAHRAMIRASWRGRRPDRCVLNAAQLAAAFVFDWNRTPARGTQDVA